MRLTLNEIALDSVRRNLIKGVCDACRECRAWDKPGHTIMPSTALTSKLNEEVERDLMFYKQEHNILHIIDRCIRYAAGIEIPDKTMTSFLDAYYQCWMQFGPAKVLYSDGEGAFDNDFAKAVPKAKCIKLSIRARGQHATTIQARNGILRHLLH
eukprot:7940517-Pyramimonas_sp.AAC.1